LPTAQRGAALAGTVDHRLEVRFFYAPQFWLKGLPSNSLRNLNLSHMNKYYLTPAGKIGKLVKVETHPDIYHINVDGKIMQYKPAFLSFIPADKIVLFRSMKKVNMLFI
jgi:hypothetical protein